MGLQTTMTTSLTGMTAAETTIDVVGNNVANANTVGFKQSSVSFATQFLQTQSIGSAPTDGRGGTNPRQVGLGVKVAEISPDFTQGTVEISSNPLDLAIQGDGFFMVQGSQGERLYTRNGQFKTNANNEIVTITGHRVLGHTIDQNTFRLLPGVSPLEIPLGKAAVAQATTNVRMEGNLNPNSQVGSTPEIIQSGILSDGSHEFPTTTAASTAITRPNINSTVFGPAAAGPGPIGEGTYSYRIVFVDASGYEGPVSVISDTISVPTGDTSAGIELTNLPTRPTADYTLMRIYRNRAEDGVTFERVAEIAGTATSHTDTAATGGLALATDTGLSSNTYSYYVTFYDSSSGNESRPGAQFGPITTDASNSPAIRLSSIPQPDPSGEYDQIRIYRNVTTDPSSFYLVDTIASGSSYIDKRPDSAIINPANRIDLEGPRVAPGTLLTEVVSRDGAVYRNLFQEGTLTFTGTKNSRALGARTFEVTATSTVQDLLTFMSQSLGIVTTASEDTFPPSSPPSTYAYGGQVVDGRLQFTANMGIENAIEIDLSAFQFTPASGGNSSIVPLAFNSVQRANGEGATAEVVVYDSLGTQVRVSITTVLEDVDSTGARFRWIATSPDHHPDTGFSTIVGTGTIETDSNGKFRVATQDRVAIDRGNSPAASPLEFKLDFSQVTGLDANTDWAAGVQDGLAAGTLTSFIITESGLIQGVFSNGSSRDLGQILMARFANNGGLEQLGDNLFAAGVNSGLPIVGEPGSQGIGNITAGAVELSNTDIGQNLIKLILASTQYRGGARVITAAQQLLDELLALRR
ncbi:MAG TPA: flagellar hook-basal body complex protein [Lacipirellulaceae bacterium]|nr:flagellar hook-basal body complex protein [Lacipirellulaceae bacterium]